jgi:hypothetical protein
MLNNQTAHQTTQSKTTMAFTQISIECVVRLNVGITVPKMRQIVLLLLEREVRMNVVGGVTGRCVLASGICVLAGHSFI